MKTLGDLPKVSFIIPTLNSEKTLDHCLKSIVSQNYPNIEIIIVDGGSKDSTISIASKYATKILFKSGPLGRARQAGADNSDGEILGIFDSDVVLPLDNWLRNAVKLFLKDLRIGIVWPINIAPPNASHITRCYFNLWTAFLNQRLRTDEVILPGGNSLILKKAFIKAGGFNPNLHYGEDFDLMSRIIHLGYKVAIAKDPIFHNTMRSLKEFTRKQLIGALTIIKAQSENITSLDLLSTCMTWKPHKKGRSKFSILKEALMDHILAGFKGMFTNLYNDSTWLIFPILISIRIIVYAGILLSYFLGKRLKHTR